MTPVGKFCVANELRKLNRFLAIRCATSVNGGKGFPIAMVFDEDCSVDNCASTAAIGSIEIPRVILGFGSVNEVACALPFNAKIADGF